MRDFFLILVLAFFFYGNIFVAEAQLTLPVSPKLMAIVAVGMSLSVLIFLKQYCFGMRLEYGEKLWIRIFEHLVVPAFALIWPINFFSIWSRSSEPLLGFFSATQLVQPILTILIFLVMSDMRSEFYKMVEKNDFMGGIAFYRKFVATENKKWWIQHAGFILALCMPTLLKIMKS